MRYAHALEMADHTITYRLIVKEIAAKNGVYATFMPKPLFGENGSGMHTHHVALHGRPQRVLRRRRPVPPLRRRRRRSSPASSSTRARSRRVFAQWVNSYKRLVPGYEAPVYVAWSQRNRSALIRIPLYKPGTEQATRAEIRCPDPACNPYLDLRGAAARRARGDREGLRAARADGDEPLPPHRRGAAASAGSSQLPETLGEAIDELAESELMRAGRSASTSSTRYVELKRQGVGRVPRPGHARGRWSAT